MFRQSMTPLLNVRDLHVTYTVQAGPQSVALAGVTFAIQHGEVLGVLGESGSGKSTLAAALVRLLPANGRVINGWVQFEGHELLRADTRRLEKIRGDRIASIFQEPSQALHPALLVEEQVRNVIAAHKDLNRRELRKKTQQILEAVFPTDTERIGKSYPHQLSGGQRARALIAQAVSCGPLLVIADEPTASLDPDTQHEVLTLFRELRQELGLSLIWITHSPALLAGFADRVLVLYAGRVAEVGPAERVLSAPQHPYTQALLRCLPPALRKVAASRKMMLPVIPGESCGSGFEANKCVFEPRCLERMEMCATREPVMVDFRGSHKVSCFKYTP